jgi:protein-S-isoprenylcysteine O-methyltransferase Ste14
MRTCFHQTPRREQAAARSGPDLARAGSDRSHNHQNPAKATFLPGADNTVHRPPVSHIHRGATPRSGLDRLIRIAANLTGAAGAAFFARASVLFYLHTHRLIGGLFVLEQAWFVVAFLARRPQRAISRRLSSWLVAFGGTFAGVLFRPDGIHLAWGVAAGFGLQLAGLVICIVSLVALGRSFGFVAADRGVKTRGPYAMVRHPVYASYLLIQSGYVMQAMSLRNIVVFAAATGCNICRALAEERLLAGSPAYRAYQGRVRWGMIPYLW